MTGRTRRRPRALALLALWIAVLPALAAPSAGRGDCVPTGEGCCCVEPPLASPAPSSCCANEEAPRETPQVPEPGCSCEIDDDPGVALHVALSTGSNATSETTLVAWLEAGARRRAPDSPHAAPHGRPPSDHVSDPGELALLRSAGPGPACWHVLARGLRRVLAELCTARL